MSTPSKDNTWSGDSDWDGITPASSQPQERVSPIGKRCFPGILHAQDENGNCLICKPKPYDLAALSPERLTALFTLRPDLTKEITAEIDRRKAMFEGL